MSSMIRHCRTYLEAPYYSDNESIHSSLVTAKLDGFIKHKYLDYCFCIVMSENVLYLRQDEHTGEDTESMEDDVWDDTLLVKAYDRAVFLTKEKIASRNTVEKEEGANRSKPEEKLHSNSGEQEEHLVKKGALKREKVKWKVGTCCRTIYSEDGLEYEAVIKSIDYENGICSVKYLGYNNEEQVDIKSLKPSKGKESQINQKAQARLMDGHASYQNGYREEYPNYQQNVGMIPPPPPPFILANLPRDEADALSAMLMAWYMSGFHTGYYQGLTKSKMTSQSFGCHHTH